MPKAGNQLEKLEELLERLKTFRQYHGDHTSIRNRELHALLESLQAAMKELYTASPFPEHDQQPPILHDMSGWKEVESALRKEREKAQMYLDVAGVMLVAIRADETVQFINQCGYEITGYDHDEIIGKNWFDNFLPESIREDVRSRFHEFISKSHGMERWRYENPIITKIGEERTIDWRNIALTDEKGDVVGTLSSGLDITDRKRTEERLRQEKEFTEHLINSSGDGIIAFDMDFQCTAWNPAMERISGVPKEETIGRVIFEKFPFLKQEQVRHQVFLDTIEGKTLSFKECSYRVPETGNLQYFDSEFVPLRDQKQNIIGGLVIIRDVTERKLSEEAIRESETRYRVLSENLEAAVQRKVSELQQAQSLAAIGQVVSIVAHEVRNPLQNIHMGLDIMRSLIERPEHQPPGEMWEVLHEVEFGVSQLNKIVTDLLEYAKPVKLHCSKWFFRDLIRRALSMLSDKLSGLSVELKMEHEDRPLIGDSDKIMRVLLNLINNAAEAMPAGGILSIRSRFTQTNKGEMFLVSISDTGAGIPEEQLKLIHEPFYTTKAYGTGLGLSICRKILEATGGEMHIRSKLHEGTTVDIMLPLRPETGNKQSGGAGSPC